MSEGETPLPEGVPMPLAVQRRGGVRRVRRIRDCWRLDDEWWRERLSRVYYVVEYEDGMSETIYCDLASGAWYGQKGTASA